MFQRGLTIQISADDPSTDFPGRASTDTSGGNKIMVFTV